MLRVIAWNAEVLQAFCALPSRRVAAFLGDEDDPTMPHDLLEASRWNGNQNAGRWEGADAKALRQQAWTPGASNTEVLHAVRVFLAHHKYDEQEFVAETCRKPRLSRLETQRPGDY